VSQIGYKTLEFEVFGSEVVDIILANENTGLDEMIVTGSGLQSRVMKTSAVSSVSVRGNSSLNIQDEMVMEDSESDSKVFLMVDDEKMVPPSPAASQPLTTISTRKNLNETAFFYPHLLTNVEGEIIINFTVPEALTKWKMLGFAHTKDLKTGLIDKTLVTSKDLMVVPNLPRFLREGDKITLTSKIVNLSD